MFYLLCGLFSSLPYNTHLFFIVCVIMIILGINFISVSVKLCKSYYHLILKRGAQKLYRNALIVDFVLKRTYMPIIYCLVAVRL